MIGLVSDIHSNLEALNAVEDELIDRRVDRIFCAGDIVGYGPNPNECCRFFKEKSVVQGNHDFSSSTGEGLRRFNSSARRALNWTNEELSEENRDFLASLPKEESLADGEIKMVHGSPDTPLWEYIYPDTRESRLKNFLEDCEVLVLGHTHLPFALELDEGIVVNPGSVGQPRDGNPMASYALLDLGEMNVRLKRVDYEKERTAEKIQDVDLPESLAERLFGGW